MKKLVLLFLLLLTLVPMSWAENPNPLVFVGQGTTNSIKLSKIGAPGSINLMCSKNYGEPEPFVIDSSYVLGVDDTLILIAEGLSGTFSKSKSDYYQFVITGRVAASGSIMALTGGTSAKIPCDYCFYSLFKQCDGLTSIPELPATTLKPNCYERMFEGCGSLVTGVDTLPATRMSNSCYQSMFENCTSLVKAPVLPSGRLASSCYNAMFRGCKLLSQIQDTLPATKVSEMAYFEMFRLCNSLQTAPYIAAVEADSSACAHMFLSCEGLLHVQDTLPTMQLGPDCFLSMYESCSQLQTAPVLMATTMAKKCYNSMFKDCVALVNTQDTLPALSLEEECYSYMFSGCKSLDTAPYIVATTLAKNSCMEMFSNCELLRGVQDTLPAMNLAEACYSNMFSGCSSITNAPVLPATQLAEACYSGMYIQCQFSSVPHLPAQNLASRCYTYMFAACPNLDTLSVAFSDWSEDLGCTEGWFADVTTAGHFMGPSDLPLRRGVDFIPESWTPFEVRVVVASANTPGMYDTLDTLIASQRQLTMPQYDISRQGKYFKGWALAAGEDTLCGPSGTLDITSDTTVFAVMTDAVRLHIDSALVGVSLAKVYDGTTLIQGSSYSGVFDNLLPSHDNVSVVVRAEYENPNATSDSSKVINVSFTPTGIDSLYYIVDTSFRITKGIITPRPLRIANLVLTQLSKTYDGTIVFDGQPSFDYYDTIAGDNPTFVAHTSFLDSAVGENKPVKVAYEWNQPCESCGNYLIPGNDTLSADINPKPLVVDGLSVVSSKVYDADTRLDVISKGVLNGVLPNDEVSLDTAFANCLTKTAGVEKDVCVTYQLSGSQSANYVKVNDTLRSYATIEPKEIGIRDYNIQLSKVYDATTVAAVLSNGILVDTFACDSVSPLLTANYDTSCVGTAHLITVNIGLTGDDAANYVMDSTSRHLQNGVITKLKLQTAEVSTADTFKVYDKTIAFGTTVLFSLPNAPTSDMVLVNATAEFLSADAGNNKRIDVTYQFDAACVVCGNYDLPDPDILYADIVPLQLTIAGTRIDATKVYDATTNAWVEPGDLENVISGDIVNVDASAAYVDKNVGASKPVVVTYSISGSAAANYYAPVNDTMQADITPFQLLAEYFAVDQSKVYDQSDSAHVILGTVNSYLGDDIFASAVATYGTNQVGNNIPVVLVFSLAGIDKDNYYAPINDTQYASITRRQLTAEGVVRVDTIRMYDATNIARITSHATMQGVLPGDQVSMFDTARYNDANPGINKTINVYYYIYGRDAGNYTAPIEFFYCNTAKILQPIVIDSSNRQQGMAFEVSSNGYCQSQTDGAIGYKIGQGEACEYRLDFGASAVGVGFQNIPWTALPNELQGEITLVIPDDCPSGQYDAIITFRNEIGVESTPTVVTFVVNLPKDYIVQIFNDVVSIDKHKIQGDSYQWYHNGEPIPGATLPYYQQEGGLTGNYYVAVNVNTRGTVRTCDQNNWVKMVEQQKIVSVYPNPVEASARVSLSNFEEGSHRISLINAQGIRVYQSVFTGDETCLNFDSYSSGTYYLSVDGITAKVVKP